MLKVMYSSPLRYLIEDENKNVVESGFATVKDAQTRIDELEGVSDGGGS